MATKADRERREAKAAAVTQRLLDMHEHVATLIGMLEEHKLDMLILALGIGVVKLEDPDAP